MNTDNLLTIQQFAQVCRTTPRTLRFYEQKGLFKPAKIDTWKYRLYDPKQARDFLKIKLLQNFHIPLKQTKEEVMVRKNPKTGEIKGFTILNFLKRSAQNSTAINLPFNLALK